MILEMRPMTDGESFIDMNGNGIWDDSQRVYVSGLSSSDPDGGSLSYTWNEISGHLSSDSIVYEEEDGSVISFVRPNFNGDMNGQVEFTLFVSDGQNISTQDTLVIKFGKPSKPLSPVLSTRTEHQKVILSWDSSAENSEDYLTGYYDFEGYRLYKSTDGGETWGTDSDKIYDDTGPLQAGNHLGNGITLKAKMNLDAIFQQDSALKIIGELMFQGMTLILIGLTLERTMVLYTLL